MGRVAELVDRHHALDAVAPGHQGRGIAGESAGIAAHRDDPRHRGFGEFGRLGGGAGARRIEDHGIETGEFGRGQGTLEQVADLGLRLAQAGGARRGADQRRDGGALAVDRRYGGALAEPQRKRADTAEEVGDPLGAADAFADERREGVLAGRGRVKSAISLI